MKKLILIGLVLFLLPIVYSVPILLQNFELTTDCDATYWTSAGASSFTPSRQAIPYRGTYSCGASAGGGSNARYHEYVFDGVSPFTLSLYIQMKGKGNYDVRLADSNGAVYGDQIRIGLANGTSLTNFVLYNGTTTVDTGVPFTLNTWHEIEFIRTSDYVSVYADDTLVGGAYRPTQNMTALYTFMPSTHFYIDYLNVSLIPSPYFSVTTKNIYSNDSINSFTVEVQGHGNYSTTNGTVITDILNTNTTDNITVWGINNYFNKSYNNYNINSDLNAYVNPYTSIYAINNISGTSLENFSINYTGGSITTTSGVVYLDLFNATYEVTIYNAYNNFTSYTDAKVNLTANDYLQNYTFELYPDPSILDISIYNSVTGNLITDNVTIQVISGAYSDSVITNTGYANFTNLTAGVYNVMFSSDNYTGTYYIQTINQNTLHHLNAYLFPSTAKTVSFLTKNQNTGESIEGASYSMATLVDDNLVIVGYKISDIAGQVTFNYVDDKLYIFTVNKPSFDSKVFQLGPTLDTEYNVWLSPSVEYNITDPYTGISINYYVNPYLAGNGVTLLNGYFTNNISNNFTFIISANNGDLLNYGFNLTYKTLSNSSTGVNAFGDVLQSQIRIINASTLDTVRLNYYYTSSVSGYHNFSEVFLISQGLSYGLFNSLKEQYFGMGLLERVLIVVIIASIFGGLINLFNGPVASGFSIAFIFGYFVYTGFIAVWFVALPIVLIFVYALWRSD